MVITDMPNEEHEKLVAAFKEALTDAGTNNRPMLVQRIPFICEDIRGINSKLWWIMTIGGAVITFIGFGVGALALKAVGA